MSYRIIYQFFKGQARLLLPTGLLLCLLWSCETKPGATGAELLARGNAYYGDGHYDSARQCYEQLLRQASTDSLLRGNAANNLGSILLLQKEYEEARVNFLYARKYYQALGVEAELSSTLVNLGIVYKNQDQYDSAAAYLYRAIPLLKAKDNRRGLFSAYNSLGNVERSRGLPLEAIALHERAIEESGSSFRRKARVYNNLGRDYQELDRPAEALAFYERSLQLKDSLGYRAEMVSTLLNMTYLLKEAKRPEAALATLKQAIEIDRAENEAIDRLKLLIEQADLLSGLGQAEEADQVLKAIEQDTAAMLPSLLLDFYLSQQTLYQQQGDWRAAYQAQEQASELRDSLSQLSTMEDLNLQATLLGLRETEDRLLLREATIANRNYQLAVAGLCLVLVTAFAWLSWRNWKKAQREKQQKEEEKRQKEEMLLAFQHLTKNQITALEGLLSIEMQRHQGQEGRLLQENKDRLSAVAAIHNQLSLREDTIGRIAAQPYFESLIYNTLLSYGLQQQVQCKTQLEALNLEIGHALWLGQLLVEAITNACKYAFAGHAAPELEVDLQLSQDTLCLQVADNGPGLPEAAASEKSGIGMSLIEAMTQQINARWEPTPSAQGGCRHQWFMPYSH